MRIAHISDFHLRQHLAGTSAVAARRSREVPALLKEAVTRIAAAGVDLTVVTGDLIDHPFADADAPDHLRDGEADLRLVADSLGRLPCPWMALPGNHDHAQLFAGVFGLPLERQIGEVRVIPFHDWEGDDHVPERVGEERSRFDRALDDDDPRLQIHVQHYLVAPERNEGYPHTYGDGRDLQQALVDDARVRLVLSGHYHAGVEPFREGATWFATAPAFCEAPHSYRVYELDAADGGLHSAAVELR